MLVPGTLPASLPPLAVGDWRGKTHGQRDLNQCGTFLMCARCGRGLLGSSACLPGLYPSVCVCLCVCVLVLLLVCASMCVCVCVVCCVSVSLWCCGCGLFEYSVAHAYVRFAVCASECACVRMSVRSCVCVSV